MEHAHLEATLSKYYCVVVDAEVMYDEMRKSKVRQEVPVFSK